MRTTRCDEVEVLTAARFAALPDDAQALCEAAGGVFGCAGWWRAVEAHATPEQGEPLFVAVRAAGRCRLVLALLRRGGQVSGLTTPYTCLFAPAMEAGLPEARRVALLASALRACGGRGVVRLDCLAAEEPFVADLSRAARVLGWRALRFEHFGNWHEAVEAEAGEAVAGEAVAGGRWAAYLAGRPGALRETVRRRLRKAEALAEGRFTLWGRPEDADAAVAAYESVYERSWKEAEPYPDFNAALIRAMAVMGWLRLGVWSIGEVPVAVQFWVVQGGRAVVLKLAHDEAFKAHSPGTVLTALMLRHLLESEAVREIDFGRGDDAYKQGWARFRRQRVGLLLVTPWRLEGATAIARQMLGRLRRGVVLRHGGSGSIRVAGSGEDAREDQAARR
jgi:hypothetical protein